MIVPITVLLFMHTVDFTVYTVHTTWGNINEYCGIKVVIAMGGQLKVLLATVAGNVCRTLVVTVWSSRIICV